MKSQPKFIKDFSKDESQDERDSLAEQIKLQRKDYFEDKAKKQEGLENQQQNYLLRRKRSNSCITKLEKRKRLSRREEDSNLGFEENSINSSATGEVEKVIYSAYSREILPLSFKAMHLSIKTSSSSF